MIILQCIAVLIVLLTILEIARNNDKLSMKIIVIVVLLFTLCSIVRADTIVNDRLINAIAQVETNCDPKAIGDDGKSIGICQISLSVLKEWNDNCRVEFTKKDLLDPQINKRLCEWYLDRLINHYGCANLKQVLAAYNGGIGNLRKVNYDVSKMPKSVREYVIKVENIIIEEILLKCKSDAPTELDLLLKK